MTQLKINGIIFRKNYLKTTKQKKLRFSDDNDY